MFNLNKRILKQALDLSPVATLIVDLNAPLKLVAYANQAFEALSGYDASELIGHSWTELTGKQEDTKETCEQMVELGCHPRLGVSDRLFFDMLPLYDRPGTPRYWVATERPVHDADSESQDSERDALLAVLRDARMHLRRLDGRDSATGILNRRAFDDLLQRDWVMARREGRSLGLLLFQLDAFEAYREVYGRHAADSCLRKVAHAITGSLRRAGDLAARFGDDQFAVLVAQSEVDKAADLAESIAGKVRGLAIHHPRSTIDRFVTVSFGAGSLVASGTNAGALIELVQDDLIKQPDRKSGLSSAQAN